MILVTGATGFIGSEILRRASRRGWRVRGLARRPDRAQAGLELVHLSVSADPRVRLADPGAVEEARLAPVAGLRIDLHVTGL